MEELRTLLCCFLEARALRKRLRKAHAPNIRPAAMKPSKSARGPERLAGMTSEWVRGVITCRWVWLAAQISKGCEDVEDKAGMKSESKVQEGANAMHIYSAAQL